MALCIMHIPGGHGGLKKACAPLELELQMWVPESYPCPLENQHALITTKSCLQPQKSEFQV